MADASQSATRTALCLRCPNSS